MSKKNPWDLYVSVREKKVPTDGLVTWLVMGGMIALTFML